MNKALGELEGGKALRAGRANIVSTESAVYRLLSDLSTKSKAYDPPPAYLQLIRTEVKPEMSHEWERVIGRYKAAAEQVPETPTAIRRVAVEGTANTYLTSSPYTKGAERDAWPSFMDVLKKAYGEEEARSLDQRRTDCIKRAEAFIMKFRPTSAGWASSLSPAHTTGGAARMGGPFSFGAASPRCSLVERLTAACRESIVTLHERMTMQRGRLIP